MTAGIIALAVAALVLLIADMVEQIGRATLPRTGCPAGRPRARDRFRWARPSAYHWQHAARLTGMWRPVPALTAYPIGQPRELVAA